MRPTLGTPDHFPFYYWSLLTLCVCLTNTLALIRPPPKSDKRLNRKLNSLWATIVSQLPQEMDSVELVEPIRDKKRHIGPDGVHLSKAGINFIENFLGNLRTEVRPQKFFILTKFNDDGRQVIPEDGNSTANFTITSEYRARQAPNIYPKLPENIKGYLRGSKYYVFEK